MTQHLKEQCTSKIQELRTGDKILRKNKKKIKKKIISVMKTKLEGKQREIKF